MSVGYALFFLGILVIGAIDVYYDIRNDWRRNK